MSRTRVTHLDRDAPNGNPMATTNSFAACGRGVHYTSLTNERAKVICWFCKQTDLFNLNANTVLPVLHMTLGISVAGDVT